MPNFVKSTVSLTVGTDAYTDNDVVGGLLIFSLAGYPHQDIFLNRVLLVDNDNEKAALLLHLYGALPTTIADDAAYTRSDADALKWQGSVDLSTYVSVSTTNATALVTDINDMYHTETGSLYGYLICVSSTPTYTAVTDLTLTLFLSEQR